MRGIVTIYYKREVFFNVIVVIVVNVGGGEAQRCTKEGVALGVQG